MFQVINSDKLSEAQFIDHNDISYKLRNIYPEDKTGDMVFSLESDSPKDNPLRISSKISIINLSVKKL